MDTITLEPGRTHDDDAFEAYRTLYSGGSDVERLGASSGGFAAAPLRTEVVAHRLPRMLLFDRRLAGVSHARAPRRVARDGFDHVTFHLVLSGSMMLEVPGATRRVEAGSLALFDLTRPQRTWTEGARIVTAAIARDRFDAASLDGLDLHGLILGPRKAGLVIDFARSLATHAAALTPEIAGAATESLCLMVGATLATLRDAHAPLPPPVAGTRARARALAYIERHLSDRNLTAAAIAEGAGVSRSVLYRLFEPVGGVARFVQRQRVAGLRRALSRADEHRSMDELASAAGFASPSHAGRLFRDTFGMPPGEYRRSLRNGASQTGIVPVDAPRRMLVTSPPLGLAAWHGELL
ncbi:helix-turn-helix domain-containing protein [Methylobacterium aquaticum]|uniref:helix-turn-helix domain-containing protein n=1 Tax=Methylobacterium aquaticum TaxID=270351 RepID=UPI0019324BFB|nr:helix-turn-helix domain-containing protein [Methylobacterium aquaticum]QRE72914.1 helix-turn-helix domain-containing protein [Methylobacterium aquaticum]